MWRQQLNMFLIQVCTWVLYKLYAYTCTRAGTISELTDLSIGKSKHFSLSNLKALKTVIVTIFESKGWRHCRKKSTIAILINNLMTGGSEFHVTQSICVALLLAWPALNRSAPHFQLTSLLSPPATGLLPCVCECVCGIPNDMYVNGGPQGCVCAGDWQVPEEWVGSGCCCCSWSLWGVK